jgi:hypothetical protein
MRVVSDAGVSASEAAGLQRKLGQATQWVQHIKATPLTALSLEWLERVESLHRCMLSHLKVFDRLGRLPPAIEQQLLHFFELLLATLIEVLKQAPALVTKCQQTPAQASSDTASSRGNPD